MAVRRVDLANLKPARGSHKKPKRLGRGPGSGHGKTAGQGYKAKADATKSVERRALVGEHANVLASGHQLVSK